MYVIKKLDGEYFHTKGKIIIFDDSNQINDFLHYFVEYSVKRLFAEGRKLEALSAQTKILSEISIDNVDFDIDSVECGVVYARDFIKR